MTYEERLEGVAREVAKLRGLNFDDLGIISRPALISETDQFLTALEAYDRERVD